MEWTKVENRPENKLNHYYVVGGTDELFFTTQNTNDELRCKLSNGSEKKLKLNFKLFEISHYNSAGTKIITTTKKWFVTDNTNEYPIEEVEVSKDDIMQYKS